MMKTITTNELKKGTRVKLSNGWKATLEDSKRSNIRLATVEGIFTEIGSIYAHDINLAILPNGEIAKVQLTPQQINFKKSLPW
jgi:hypothetical protein